MAALALGLLALAGLILWNSSGEAPRDSELSMTPAGEDASASRAESPAGALATTSTNRDLTREGGGLLGPPSSDLSLKTMTASEANESSGMPSRRELSRMSSFKRRHYFDRRAAAETGMSPEEVEELYKKWEVAQLAIDVGVQQSIEEGRPRRPGPRIYDDKLRDFLSEDEFDVVLYATDQLNRVRLGSPAEGGRPMAEGFLPGDVIETYNGVPVHRLTDLQLMMKAQRGVESVPVTVRRNQLLIQLSAPGGHHLGPKYPRHIPPIWN